MNRWEGEIKLRLMSDLATVSSWSNPDESFESELRMAGVCKNEQVVKLSPTVCICCMSKACRKEFERAVKDLEYLASFSAGRVEVRLGAPKLAAEDLQFCDLTAHCDKSSSGRSQLSGPQLGLLEDFETEEAREMQLDTMYNVLRDDRQGTLELEQQREAQELHDRWLHRDWMPQESLDGDSACGIKFKTPAIRGGELGSKISTIGGLIMIDGMIYGLTTGHGILPTPSALARAIRTSQSSESESESESESAWSDSDTTSCNASEIDVEYTDLGRRNARTIQRRNIPRGGLISYCGQTGTGLCNDSSTTDNSDFALVDLQLSSRFELYNQYHKSQGASDETLIYIDDVKHDSDLDNDEVLILSGKGRSVGGYLLATPASFRNKDALFQTRKIELDTPFRTTPFLEDRQVSS